MHLLNCKKYEDVVSWTYDGKAFIVHKPSSFARKALPSHFKETKFSSFRRKVRPYAQYVCRILTPKSDARVRLRSLYLCQQLYRWGFTKSKQYGTIQTPAYAHEVSLYLSFGGKIIHSLINDLVIGSLVSTAISTGKIRPLQKDVMLHYKRQRYEVLRSSRGVLASQLAELQFAWNTKHAKTRRSLRS